MKYLLVLFSGLLLIGSAGCNTTEGLGQDVEAAGEAIEDAAEEAEDEIED